MSEETIVRGGLIAVVTAVALLALRLQRWVLRRLAPRCTSVTLLRLPPQPRPELRVRTSPEQIAEWTFSRGAPFLIFKGTHERYIH